MSIEQTQVFSKSEKLSYCVNHLESTCNSWPLCYGCNNFMNPTNYDKIIKMRPEELAQFLCGNRFPSSEQVMLKWLNSKTT